MTKNVRRKLREEEQESADRRVKKVGTGKNRIRTRRISDLRSV